VELAFIGAVLGKNHYFGLRVKCPLFLSDFKQTDNMSYTQMCRELYCNKRGVTEDSLFWPICIVYA
jgi:hypothetical protein